MALSWFCGSPVPSLIMEKQWDVRKKKYIDTVQCCSTQGSLLGAATFGWGRSSDRLLGGQWWSAPSRSVEGAAPVSLKSNSQLYVVVPLLAITQIRGSQTSRCQPGVTVAVWGSLPTAS